MYDARYSLGVILAILGIMLVYVAFVLHARRDQTGAAKHKHKLLYSGLIFFTTGQFLAR